MTASYLIRGNVLEVVTTVTSLISVPKLPMKNGAQRMCVE